MIAIRAEGQSDEITLGRGFGEARLREIGELVGLEIKDGDGLMSPVGLGTVAVVEERGIVLVWTPGDGAGKSVEGSEVPGRGDGELLAGGEWDLLGDWARTVDPRAQKSRAVRKKRFTVSSLGNGDVLV